MSNMSLVSFYYIHPTLWSTLTSMPQSRMAFVTILSTLAITIVESKCNFDATSFNEDTRIWDTKVAKANLDDIVSWAHNQIVSLST